MKRVKFVIILISILVGLTGLFKLSDGFINIYPKTDKLKLLLNSNLEYGDDLKYVKLKGEVNQIYKRRFGIFFGIKPTVFEYIKDSIFDKKVFHIDKKGVIWFFQRGENRANLQSLQKGDWLEKDFGELRFNKSNDIK